MTAAAMPDSTALVTAAATSDSAGLVTAAEVRALAGRLISDELVIVPVRHHSPACAWQLRRAFTEHTPSTVLVEAPRGFTDLIPLLTAPEARMPLAVYTYASVPGGRAEGGSAGGGSGEGGPAGGRSEDGGAAEPERHAAYYPFCDYSPELVALREAAARNVPARFIDLELAEQMACQDGAAEPTDWVSLLDERQLSHSHRLQRLAERLGCRDTEDLWERLFEVDPDRIDFSEHVARVAAYCLLARRDHTAGQLADDGAPAREAEMVWHVRRALAERPADAGPVLVVVGGFHAVALPDLLADPPPRPALDTEAGERGTALIRYGFDRLDRLNGYAAGMTSPAWHQRLWQSQQSGASGADSRREAALEVLLDVASTLRTRRRMPLATPSVAAAYEQAQRLAQLRGHGAPLRSDLLDAVTSCFVKGDADIDGQLAQQVTLRILRGDAIGTLPPGTGTPPLVRDVIARLSAARLRVDDIEQRRVNLDLYRRPSHRATSRLLYGLRLLEVPFAIHAAGPDFVAGTRLGQVQERWEYAWSPQTEGALVEASVWGSTLPEAVRARFASVWRTFQDGPDRADARAATALLAHACVLGLHQDAAEIVAAVREAIHADPRFDAAAEAACHLALLQQGREPLQADRLRELPQLLRSAYERAIYLGREMLGGHDPDATVTALSRLRELLLGEAGSGLDAELYWAMVHHLRSGHANALVRGAATGIAHVAGQLDGASLGEAVTGHLNGTAPPDEAVDFTRGLLETARETAWQDSGLVPALDVHLASWDEAAFLRYLPQLRLAFSGLTPAETDRVAELVAARHGLGDLGRLSHRDVDEETVARHLALSEAVTALAHRDGLGGWLAR